jgi:hypothetical protein
MGIGAGRALADSPPATSNIFSGGTDFKTLGYAEMGSNDSGRALFQSKAGTSAKAVMMDALHDVAKILGTKVTVTSAFDDQKQDHSSGANFTATINGTPIKGSVLTAISSNGGAISIVYAIANCPAHDWSQLLADLPASIKLTDTTFGNGAGTIGLPDGWTIANSDTTGTVMVAGPNGEQVQVNLSILVLAPGSPPAQSQLQMMRMAMQFGHKPLRGNPIAQIGTPAQAIQNIYAYGLKAAPLFGDPIVNFKEVISEKPLPADQPNVQNAVVYFTTSQEKNNQTVITRSLTRLSVTQLPPQLQGDWHMEYTGVSAPDNLFDKELPTMIAIWNSYKPNMQQIMANDKQNMAQMQATFRQTMANLKAINDSTDQMIADQQAQEMASDRSSADFDEVIRGYRTVEDTQTGEQSDVNLADSHAIVDKLNEGDPGRYIEIPLRDTLDPY